MGFEVGDLNHYTNKRGWKGIRATPTWCFRASRPPGDHPAGAYFTTLTPDEKNLANKLGIPRSKLEFVFAFDGMQELVPAPFGDPEDWIFYSPVDYLVERERQVYQGAATDFGIQEQ